MESARVSVRNNPFINLFEEENSEINEVTETVAERPVIYHSRDYKKGFTDRKRSNFPSRINNELYTSAVRDSAMREASETLRQNRNVMDSLKFLNTQAAIALNKSFLSTEPEQVVKEITFGL